ncbi:nucleotide sugar dehydrogenase [Iodidimonas muriae]|uniref:Nucleotide sugar dehydrogenase n=1 Tax=Iodidimonas muriae TaxID=261467 RepID=A0ABQ2LCV4_9PROT|nr:Vi polysaccharide biosynthesis UDP-N-acetylglucosamine C-6 dehydrogenase TviB [Iodidimonas muriae]GER07261.1 nucleotide sugar dehydrogenase [Kordiimonadales bacterium JCM 17843]GGO11242.1 nucleotide sugar dehydrogenase [Iodidimonas muriae]
MQSPEQVKLAIIGLGYVGLPLAVAFGRRVETVGYDINKHRVAELKAGHDATLEATAEELSSAALLRFTSDLDDIRDCTVFIVTVPTPIDSHLRPDLTPLIKASESIGQILKPGDLVIYESTVYPGATEEVCVPILEQVSGLKYKDDFCCGYSPERINPGDKDHRLHSIVKVTSGSTPQAADFVDALYKMIIEAGTHRASSIRVAEAAKVIENTQRDLNIALVNELAVIFNKLGIDTLEVLEAAGTKWNFLPFRPGLVGGHCIGVDPYYLTYKAEEVRHHPEVILAGRRINDGMGRYIAGEIIKKMIHRKVPVSGAKVLVLGLTFKENCPDLRNTRVVDIVTELTSYGAQVSVYDPWVDRDEATRECGVTPLSELGDDYDAVVLAVAHHQFITMGADAIRALGRPGAVLYDIKSVLPRDQVDARL